LPLKMLPSSRARTAELFNVISRIDDRRKKAE
jgi:hypothetical protein